MNSFIHASVADRNNMYHQLNIVTEKKSAQSIVFDKVCITTVKLYVCNRFQKITINMNLLSRFCAQYQDTFQLLNITLNLKQRIFLMVCGISKYQLYKIKILYHIKEIKQENHTSNTFCKQPFNSLLLSILNQFQIV